MKYIVYVLVCKNNSFFVGMTTNTLINTYKSHLNKRYSATKEVLPVFVVYYKQFNNKAEAIKLQNKIEGIPHEEMLNFLKESIKDYESDIDKPADEVRVLLHENHGVNGIQYVYKDEQGNMLDTYSRCMNPDCPFDGTYVSDINTKSNNKAYILK